MVEHFPKSSQARKMPLPLASNLDGAVVVVWIVLLLPVANNRKVLFRPAIGS